MKQYFAILDRIQPVRRRTVKTVPLGEHQDAEAALAHFAAKRRVKLPNTPTIIICAEGEKERLLAALTQEPAG